MEDQILNPFRAPKAGGQAARRPAPAEDAPPPPPRLFRELPLCLALAALVLVAYWGVWNLDFVFFDDPGYVKDNMDVKLGLPLFNNPDEILHEGKLFKAPAVFFRNVHWAFTAFVQSNWHPLTWLSHMLDVQFYGLNAGWHHLTNLIFHGCNTLLLFWLLRWLTGRSWCSAAVAACFAVHPMHVESVAWIAERKDVLSTFLALLTLMAYALYARKADLAKDSGIVLGVLSGFTWLLALLCVWWFHDPRQYPFQARLLWGFIPIDVRLLWCYVPIFGGIALYAVLARRYNVLLYCLVFVLFAAGLLAKPMLVTLPCVCLLLDYWPLKRFALPGAERSPRPAPVERPAGPRRKAKRNQRLPERKTAAPARQRSTQSLVKTLVLLVLEKVPLAALSLASAAITPYAQAHGGSVASTDELPISFRLENALQSYAAYIGRLFWPGKMMSLHLLPTDENGHPHVDVRLVAISAVVVGALTAAAVVAFLHRRHYLTFGWLWYLGTLVPVIGFVQVGEQAMADRYTYIPYIGLFVAAAWGIADLVTHLTFLRRNLTAAAALATAVILGSWTTWANCQVRTWRDVQTHLLHALSVEPDNWNMLNNYGVWLWKQAQEQDVATARAEAVGDLKTAKECHEKSVAFKAQARTQWTHGIRVRPTATDIHSNLGYMYSEANDLAKAEWHLIRAVELKPISPRPHNNLGRVLLRRSQESEADAHTAEAKGKTDPAEAAKAAKFRHDADVLLKRAIKEFETAVQLDNTLLEARLNLGEVYLRLKDLDKAEMEYGEVLKLKGDNETDRETIGNFSQACIGLARVALARKRSDDAVKYLLLAVQLKPDNVAALQLLAIQRFERDEYREGQRCLWPLLEMLPAGQRRVVAEQVGGQLRADDKGKEAVQAWNFVAWAFATDPEARILDPQAAVILAQRVVALTKQQDPAALDTLAAAQAATGQYGQAVRVAEAAASMASSQGNRRLAAAIASRAQFYRQGKPYRSNRDGSDRP